MVDFNEVEVILAYLLFCGTQGLNNVFVVLWYTGTQQCICCFVVHRDSTMYLLFCGTQGLNNVFEV